MAFRLYTYWRSSAAFRVRIALALKGLEYESVPKHLLRDGGEQRKPDYLAVNPQGLIPALADDDFVIPQSLAICEYLDEIHPEPQLLPGSARDRATVRGMAMVVACDTHPKPCEQPGWQQDNEDDQDERTRFHGRRFMDLRWR